MVPVDRLHIRVPIRRVVTMDIVYTVFYIKCDTLLTTLIFHIALALSPITFRFFFHKHLTPPAQVPGLLDGAKHCQKNLPSG